MPPEATKDVQRKQFERALKSLRDLGPTIVDAASYAEEAYLASDRPDVELANAREYIVSTLANVAESLASAAGQLSANVQREGEEAIANTELLLAAYSQKIEALNSSSGIDDCREEFQKQAHEGEDVLGQAQTPLQQSMYVGDVTGNHENADESLPDMLEPGGAVRTEHPVAKSSRHMHRQRNSLQGSLVAVSVQDCLDKMAGLPPKKLEATAQETTPSQNDTPSAREQTPTPASLHKIEAMFESPPWDWKPIEKVYTAESSLDGDGSSAFGTPVADIRGRQDVVRSTGTRGMTQRQTVTLKASTRMGGTPSVGDSSQHSRRPAGGGHRAGVVPRADTGDTSHGDWDELEIRAALTDEYLSRGYDDGEMMMLGEVRTPEGGPLDFDKRLGDSGGIGHNPSGAPCPSTTPHRTRKRDIIKRAISKFKLNGHEQSGMLGEGHMDQSS